MTTEAKKFEWRPADVVVDSSAGPHDDGSAALSEALKPDPLDRAIAAGRAWRRRRGLPA